MLHDLPDIVFAVLNVMGSGESLLLKQNWLS